MPSINAMIKKDKQATFDEHIFNTIEEHPMKIINGSIWNPNIWGHAFYGHNATIPHNATKNHSISCTSHR